MYLFCDAQLLSAATCRLNGACSYFILGYNHRVCSLVFSVIFNVNVRRQSTTMKWGQTSHSGSTEVNNRCGVLQTF